MKLNEDQIAARMVGMQKGVPEDFAINCKVVAYMDLTLRGVVYRPKDTFTIYDSRLRDKLRKMAAIAVVDDAFLPTQAPATTIATSVNNEVDHGTKASSEAPDSGSGGSDENTATRAAGKPRRKSKRTGPRGGNDLQ